jgi:superfamily II DNA or RNA helicase
VAHFGGWPAHQSELVNCMPVENKLEPGKRVQSDRFGQGSVEYDKGSTVIVRFDHGIEECERDQLKVIRSVADSIAGGNWDPAFPVVAKALASAIISVNDTWGVFSRSRIALLPHQLWVCRRVLSSWPARWLVADDVGLGKTIEAGLILWPLLSKGLVRRLLIVCPASLVEQWQYRLRTMFDIRLARYVTEADSDRGDFWNTHNHVVASLSTLRLDRGGRHQRLFESPPWDLLIIDEAHHVNADEDSGPTLGYRLAQRLVENKLVTSMIFFTGTPHRGKNFGFLSLLQLLRPDLFDPQLPLARQLHHMREAIIRNNKNNVTDLQGKRLFQPPAVKSETYTYSTEERRFYGMLTEFILSGKAYASTLAASDQRLAMLVLIAMQKLASSSVAAIRRALRGRLQRLVAQRQKHAELRRRLDDIGAEYKNLEDAGPNDETGRLEEELAELAAGVQLMADEEPRLRELLAAADLVRRETKIEKVLSLLEGQFANRSVVFFTEYKATQSLLLSELVQRFGDDSVAFINGDGRADDVVGRDGRTRTIHQTREDAAEAFNQGWSPFLISTEAGGEGIDLQEHCHSLVHVDLPWNPMRLHQRVGRLNRYGQKERVEVITLRNPETVEARIWDKLNAKINSIMLAFSPVMDEPEDLLQMVLGMTSSAMFREIFAEAQQVAADSLGAWFDQKTATFGGREAITTVSEIVGHCERFDFQAVGAEVPPVDLPDLRPFLETMLMLNRRRPKRGEDGSLAFKTPDAWMDEVGVRSSYEGLVFDRTIRGKDAINRVLGVGHKVIEQALRQATSEPTCAAIVSAILLHQPFVIARVIDRVTGKDTPLRDVVLAAERSAETGQWSILRDWQAVRRLNELVENLSVLRRPCEPPAGLAEIQSGVASALRLIEIEVPKLMTGFRVPQVEPLVVLWPGTESVAPPIQDGMAGPNGIDELE